MNEPDELRRQFRELAESVPQQPGDVVERRILADFRAHHRRRRMWAWAAQAAVLLIAAFSLYIAFIRHAFNPHGPLSRGGAAYSSATAPADIHTDVLANFVPLPYAQSGVPLGEAIIMRVELQVSAFSSLGVPVQPRIAGETITADVLVGQDGVARAVRFVQ
ncbi:MAG: hypothetical protein WB992_04160 [Bryobacteraceae bacterium]